MSEWVFKGFKALSEDDKLNTYAQKCSQEEVQSEFEVSNPQSFS